MTKKRIKPFAKPGYTMVNNAILDHIMPQLSGSGWKILCVAIRQTIGWEDEESPTGRKLTDRISYSQFQEKSGIKGRSTVSRAIKECLGKQYLKRHPSTDHQQSFDYSLNRDFEMEIETGPETGLVTSKTGPKTGLVTGPETGLVSAETGPETGHTKERLNKGGKKGGLPSSSKKQSYVESKYAHLIDH